MICITRVEKEAGLVLFKDDMEQFSWDTNVKSKTWEKMASLQKAEQSHDL